jgi:hypothetical protein
MHILCYYYIRNELEMFRLVAFFSPLAAAFLLGAGVYVVLQPKPDPSYAAFIFGLALLSSLASIIVHLHKE